MSIPNQCNSISLESEVSVDQKKFTRLSSLHSFAPSVPSAYNDLSSNSIPVESYISFKVQFNGNLSVQPSLSGVVGGFLLCDPQHHFPVFSAYHRGYKVSPALLVHHSSLGQKPASCVPAWQCGLGLKVGLCNQKPTPLLKAGSPRHNCLTLLGVPHVSHL